MTKLTAEQQKIHKENGADLALKQAKEEEAKKNYNFVQVSKSNMKAMLDLQIHHPAAFSILWFFGQRMNKQNAIMVSYTCLEQAVQKSRATISSALKLLAKEKWIQIIKVGGSNAYVVNSAVFWQGAGNMKTAVFNAVVIATRSEQAKNFDENIKLKHMPILSITDEERLIISNDEEELPPPDQENLDLN